MSKGHNNICQNQELDARLWDLNLLDTGSSCWILAPPFILQSESQQTQISHNHLTQIRRIFPIWIPLTEYMEHYTMHITHVYMQQEDAVKTGNAMIYDEKK